MMLQQVEVLKSHGAIVMMIPRAAGISSQVKVASGEVVTIVQPNNESTFIIVHSNRRTDWNIIIHSGVNNIITVDIWSIIIIISRSNLNIKITSSRQVKLLLLQVIVAIIGLLSRAKQ